jgi:hypothetical protein
VGDDVKEPLKVTFSVGDRVAVYAGIREIGEIKSVPMTGIFSPGTLQVVLDRTKSIIFVHPKQCRRIVKKKPREWNVWVRNRDSKIELDGFFLSEGGLGWTQIRVREVRK